MLITQNGESKIDLMDIDTYQRQQTMALLKILALGGKQIQDNGNPCSRSRVQDTQYAGPG